MGTAGALFLTAGYGRRDEPLSLIRPKCLLPWSDTTVLGRLAGQTAPQNPDKIRINASRCPDEILGELYEVWPKERCRLYFEERPLGTSATLARLSSVLASGSWIVANTDMVLPELDLGAMMRRHEETGAAWTVLTGGFPPGGSYTPLRVDSEGRFGGGGDIETHYWGISIMEPSISTLAGKLQACGGLFTELAPLARERCGELLTFHQEGQWLDMGRLEGLRENILRGGSFIHPTACVSSDAVLEGSWHIGRGCMIGGGTELRDSVMLEGSTLESGRLEGVLLPWFCSSIDGEWT